MPKTLNQAYTLAKLQERSLQTLQQELKFTKNPYPLYTNLPREPNTYKKPSFLPINMNQTKIQPRNTPLLPKPTYNPTVVAKNANEGSSSTKVKSSIDFDDMRAKGLCF